MYTINPANHQGLVKNMAVSLHKSFPTIDVCDIVQEINMIIMEYSSPIPEQTEEQKEREIRTGKATRKRTTTYDGSTKESTFIMNIVYNKAIQTLKYSGYIDFTYNNDKGQEMVFIDNSSLNIKSESKDGNETELIDLIEDNSEDTSDSIENKESINIINKALSALSENERKVISLRYVNDTMTLQEIGKKLNLTNERIRQIELKAISKLKNSKFIKEIA
jgi:RNA polymerase sigma factor (sigma-70 family)